MVSWLGKEYGRLLIGKQRPRVPRSGVGGTRWDRQPKRIPWRAAVFCDCAAAQRVAFITIGQSPRSDMVPEILSHPDAEIEPLEYGVFDGLPIETLRAHAPWPGEQSLITRLNDGNDVVLSKTWIQRRQREMCK